MSELFPNSDANTEHSDKMISAYNKLREKLMVGIDDVKTGRTRPLADAIADIKQRRRLEK